MRIIAILLFAVVIVLLVVSFANPQKVKSSATNHSQWVANSLKEIQTVKVGMTRQDLLKIFTTEGGWATRRSRTYVYRQCHYIKVHVEFESVGEPKDNSREFGNDKIISPKPYLENMVID